MTDAASDLVVAYLRLNDFFVLKEIEMHLWEEGAYRALTDVDIVAVRHRTPSGPTRYRNVIDHLGATGRVLTPMAQVRMVAFGHGGSVSPGMAVSHSHMVDWLTSALARHHELFEISVFSDPVLSLLALLSRIGHPIGGSEAFG